MSFTFDDFPLSAAQTAGAVLERYGVRGTYYASLGLMGTTSDTGEIFKAEDLRHLLSHGHEVGCHTFDHCHAYSTPSDEFCRSVKRNRDAMQVLVPGTRLATLSYPIGSPRPGTKRRCGAWFQACRAGGQTFNLGTVDLNHLKSFFIEQSRDDWRALETVVRQSAAHGGWLIFSTHDVTDTPTRFGCSPHLFEKLVDLTLRTGACILPVSAALVAAGVTVETMQRTA